MKPSWHARPVYIAGIGITKWGYLPEVESHQYGGEAIRGAIADADDFEDLTAEDLV